jgi:hypothetical protein
MTGEIYVLDNTGNHTIQFELEGVSIKIVPNHCKASRKTLYWWSKVCMPCLLVYLHVAGLLLYKGRHDVIVFFGLLMTAKRTVTKWHRPPYNAVLERLLQPRTRAKHFISLHVPCFKLTYFKYLVCTYI